MNKYFIEIEKWLQSTVFEPGVALPSVNELAEKFGASADDIEDAISELIYEGQLERARPEPSPVVRVPKTKLWGTLGGSHSITNEAKKTG